MLLAENTLNFLCGIIEQTQFAIFSSTEIHLTFSWKEIDMKHSNFVLYNALTSAAAYFQM